MSKRDKANQEIEELAEQAQDTGEALGRIGSKAGSNAARAGSKVVEGVKKGSLGMIVFALVAVASGRARVGLPRAVNVRIGQRHCSASSPHAPRRMRSPSRDRSGVGYVDGQRRQQVHC